MAGYYYKFGKCWEVEKLWEATKDNPTEDVNVEAFMNEGMQMYWNIGTFKQLAEEMKLVLNADYSYPIIFDEEDCIVDGAHRLVHAYIDGVETVKGVVITNKQWPEPEYDEHEAIQREEKEERLLSFKQEVEGLRNISDAEEYAKQLANLFLGNGLSLQTILLMAIDFGQQHPHWIPVEEELPPENGKTQQSISVWATNGLTSGEFRYNFDTKTWTDMWGDPFDITHWMPLPQPPRKEE